ncbi:MAG TPA: Ig-like domain-containing protein, partial [Gemmatimonadales bacterium]|nr:Ig-like domain-containing protein [Gemmatimonadales bacterium]
MATCQADKAVGPSGGRLEVSRQRWVDSAAQGSRAPRTMTVGISNAAAGELGWTATRLGSSPWLSLAAASGTAPGTLDVTADPRGLAAGVYEDTIVVLARSPARGEARVAVQFVIHPCRLGLTTLNVELTGRLDLADCGGPHRSGMLADLFSFTGTAGDSVSVELESVDFTPYLILDTAAAASAPPLAETGLCAYAPGASCLRYQRLPRTGTFVIEVTTAVAGDSGAYQLRLFRPRPPSAVDSIAQLHGDSISVIATGGVIEDSTIVLRGTASDPDGGDSVRLEVEIRPVDTPFTGSPTIAGTFVPAGRRAFARVGVSDNTAYHWRVRVVDQTGRVSSWSDFGGNSGSSPDVSVAINDGPSAPTELGQFKGDGLAAIAVGGLTDEAMMVMKGTVLDPDAGDSVRLEVEVRAVGTPFTGFPTSTSALVPSGAIAVVTVVGLTDHTLYHWQARAVDRSGRATAWSSFGDNGEAGIDFFVALPNPPALPSAMGQFRNDGVTAVAPADTIPERSIRLQAMLTDVNVGDQLRLEVEIQPAGTPFIDAASGSSLPVASGEVASVVITGLPENTSYHWQARVVDQSGRASAWTAFSNNPDATPDFHIRVPATQLAFMVQPGTTSSGTALAPAIQVAAQDGEGNTLASFTAPIAIALGNNPAGGALAGTLTVNAVAGIATFADIRIDRAGSGYNLVASATGPAPATSTAFGITPGAAVRLAILTQPPDSARSGQPFARQPMVQLLDAAGNTVSQSGATVVATIGSGGGVLSGTTAVLTNAEGIAMFTNLSLSGLVGSHTLVFEGPELAGVTSSAVNLSAGSPSTVIMSAGNGQTAIAGTAVALPPAVMVQDAGGNPVSGVAVTFAAGPGNGHVSPVTPVLTNASGIAAASSWTLGTAVGIDSVTATISGLSTGAPVVFVATVTAGAPSQMSVAGGDRQVDTVAQTLPTALAVRIADQFDNPVPNIPISWAVLDGAGAVDPPSSFTDANGIATTNWTLGTAMTPTDSMQSLEASGGGAAPVTFTAWTVPGPVSATQTSVSAFPATISASGGSSASTVTTIVRDQFGNVIKGKTAVLGATGTGNALTQPTTASDANGVVTGLLSATAAGGKTVFVVIDGTEMIQTAAVTVVAADVSAELSTVTAAPGVLTASDGANSATITVTARDAFGNPIEGAAVVLAATGTGNALTQPAATTDAQGMATGTLSATTAESKLISVTINGTEITEKASLTIAAADADATQSTVVAAPSPITAGDAGATITVTARDAFGNPVAGATVVLAATGTGNTLTQPAATTNAAGVAMATLAATGAGGKVVSASINGTAVTQTSTVIVTPAGVSAAQSTVTTAPSIIIASNGASSATLSVTARDAFGNPIEGATVLLAASGTGTAVTQPGATDANGTTTGTLSATAAGDKVISATIDGTGIAQTTTVTVTAAAVSPAHSSVTALPGAITAGTGTSSATISVTARDQFGNPIQGTTVELAATGAGNTLTQPAGSTDASGTATGTLSSTWAEAKTVSATIGGTGISQTTTVTVVPASVSATQSTVIAERDTITASGGESSATITVTARDQFDNLIEGASVVLTATGSGNTLTQPTATNPAGVATGALSATAAGEKVVLATIGGTGIAQTAIVTVTPAGVSAAQSTVAATPSVIMASQGASAATITVTARDQFGNPIPGVAVGLAATGSGNTVNQPGTTTDANGVATGTVSATGAGEKVLSVTIDGTSITQTTAVTVEPAGVDAAQSTVTAAPGTIGAGSDLATITVTARDQFGNVIEGATVVLAASGQGNSLTQPATTTDGSGVAAGALSTTVAETKIVSVSINETAVAQTATIAVAPGPVSATQSTVVAETSSITAGSGIATITVTARDQFGNPIEGAAVVLTATGGGNTVTQPAMTNAAGVATGTLSATLAEGKTVSATIDGTGITQTAAVTVTPAGVSATQSTLTAASGTITASEGTSSTSIAVTARDAFGNPIQGATVVLAASGSGNTLTQPAPTDANGLTIGTLSATGAGAKVISATIDGTGVTQTATVLVTPAGVSATQSTVVAAPGS